MGEFGWAYISGSAPIQSAGGVSGSVQFATDASNIAGSNKLRYKDEIDTLELTGTLKVVGAITASSYHIEDITNLNAAGSTTFGNSSDDTHIFTGSMHIEGPVGVTGSVAATEFRGNLIGDGSQITNLPAASGVTHANSGQYRLVTSVDSTSIQGESNLLWELNNLKVTGSVYGSSLISGSTLQGDGQGIDNINASEITHGTLNNARLPSTISVTNFNGDGGGLNNLNASNIATGTLNKDRLPSEVSVTTVTGSTGLSGSVVFAETGKFSRDLTVEGTLTAGIMNVSATGDTIIGNDDADEHQFTGSVFFKGPVSASTGVSASVLIGDGSQITNLPPYGAPAIATYSNAAQYRLVSSVNSNTVQGESNLIWENNNLKITGSVYTSHTISGSEIITGKVGIGTQNPAQKLTVDAGNIQLTNGYQLQWGDADTAIFGNATTDYVRIKTAGLDRFSVDSSGKVGIGTINPDHKLAVIGNVSASVNISASAFYGDGSNLTNVSSPLIVKEEGANITTSAASINFVGAYVTASTSGNDVTVTVNAGAGGGSTIGAAEDGSYTDGLFTDFTTNTTIGTAVDKFNEVLKILAPSPAPGVQSANANTSTGVTAKLSFGASAPVGGVASSDTAAGFSAVDRNGVYQPATNGANFRRGIYNNTDIEGTVNYNIVASVTNGNYAYREDSFGNGDTGTLKLEVNNVVVHSINLATFTGAGSPPNGTDDTGVNGDGSGFINVSTAANTIDGNGASWGSIFKYRSADYIVKAATQRPGWNYLRVIHSVGGSDSVSNYIEWINDPNPPAMKALTARIEDINLIGARYLSGVKYNTDATAKYKVDLHNVYRDVYPNGGTPISFTVTNSTIPPSDAVDPLGVGEDNTKIISVTGSLNFDKTPDVMLGNSITCNVSVTHPLKANMTNTGSAAASQWLIDNRTIVSDNDTENFHDESFRKVSASYDTQNSVIAPSSYWNSQTHMLSAAGHDDGLLFYNTRLHSPKQGAASGDFSSMTNGPAGNPDYSGVSGHRTFYRVLTASTGQAYDVRVITNHAGTTFNNSSLGTGNMHMFVKVPGTTGWMDATQNFNYGEIGDFHGALNPTATNTATTRYLTFGTASAANGQHLMFKFVADASWTGNISSIEFDPNVSTATDAAGLATIDVDQNGTNAKLSFGANNTISGYSNVAGSGLGTMTTINENAAYTSSGNRKGVFNSFPAITGDVNGNSGQFKKAYQGALILEINGVERHSVDLHTLTAIPNGGGYNSNGNGSGFDLSAVAFRQGPANANDYRYPYRTGKYTVGVADQRLGWNYVRVLHNEDKRPTQTIAVTVVSGIFNFDGAPNVSLNLKVGNTYRFDITDSSNGTHPLRFSTTSDGSHGGGSEYTTGVTVTGTYIQIIPQAEVTLYPYCTSHSGMGGSTQLNVTTPQINQTTYGQWVVDTDATSMVSSSAELTNFFHDELYYQSGVGYFAQRPSGSLKYAASNVYRNVYWNGSTGITFPITNNSSITNIKAEGNGVTTIDVSSHQNSLPQLNNSTNCEQQVLNITGTVLFDNLVSIKDSFSSPLFTAYGVSVDSLVKHPFKANLATKTYAKSNFMRYSGSIAGTTNLQTREDFETEDFRIAANNYANQAAVTAGSNAWVSSYSVNDGTYPNHQDGLVTVKGYVISPLKIGNAGDTRNVAQSGVLQAPNGNPNYSTGVLTNATRTLYRYFRNQSGVSSVTPTITLYGDANIVAKSGAFYTGALGANKNINVELKVPSDPAFTGLDDTSTAWGDCIKPYSAGTQPTSDGVGIYNGGGSGLNQTVGGSGRAVSLQLQQSQIRNGQYIVVKITAHKDWTGYLSRIDITY